MFFSNHFFYGPKLIVLIVLVGSIATSKATSYYVSSTGLDSRDGLSAATAWGTLSKINNLDLNAGDKVFFEGGKIFTGTLSFGSDDVGASGNVILISSYGTGRATINGTTGNAINMSSCQYLTLKNMNCVGDGRQIGKNNRGRGVYPNGVQHCIIDSIDVSGFQRAGLEMQGCTDLRITHVYAYDNGYAGISSGPESAGFTQDLYIGYCRAIHNPGDPTVTSNHSGNGIVLYKVNRATVEYCEAADGGAEQNQSNMNGPAGIWCCYSDYVTIQYCVSHDNKTQPGTDDGDGFDFDGDTHNCILQYCYTYDNYGPSFLLCTWASNQSCSDNTVRYCIGQNDGYGIGRPNVWVWHGDYQTNIHVYNNTFYNKDGRSNVAGLGINSDEFFRNNIFAIKGTGGFFGGNDGSDGTYQGNCYWAYDFAGNWHGSTSLAAWRTAKSKESLNGQNTGINADPRLTNPGNGAKITDPTQLVTLTAYKLLTGSPCIDAGLNMNTLFSINPGTRDFLGNAIPNGSKFDVGACEASSTTSIAPKKKLQKASEALPGFKDFYLFDGKKLFCLVNGRPMAKGIYFVKSVDKKLEKRMAINH